MKRHQETQSLVTALTNFSRDEYPLQGLSTPAHYSTFAMQLIDSIRRIRYVEITTGQSQVVTPLRAEPNSDYFDPLLAAKLHRDAGNYDEACWLIFLATHFGRNIRTKWQLCRDIYSGLGTRTWTWQDITSDFQGFSGWYDRASVELTRDSRLRQYGNHRKYETLRHNSRRAIPVVFRSYIDFIGQSGSHAARFSEAETIATTPQLLFALLYSNMRSVVSFGRTAKFDYLTMLKKTGLLDIEPGHLFRAGSTGPIKGCRLLFSNSKTNGDSLNVLNEKLTALSLILPVQHLQMQVLEDALCNWQKSPDQYRYFGG